MAIHALVLTPEQQEVVEYFQAYNVRADWFIGTSTDSDGAVEVTAIGVDFVWAFMISPNGSHSSREAKLGDFETGLNI
jgi:hypothetical protein